MIYLIDEEWSETSHSKFVVDIIKNHSDVEIKILPIPQKPKFSDILSITNHLSEIVRMNDVVLCTWAVDKDERIDDLFNKLAEQCWVVVAAGNFNKNISEYSPASAEYVTTVACLNKAGIKAALSNYSDTKQLVWLAGTNYNVGWKNSSGTSVSAAVYAAFLSEALKHRDLKILDNLIKSYTENMLGEINFSKDK